MNSSHFIDHLDDARIVNAIAAAEKTTSGEIRVYVSRKKRTDPLRHARERFLKLGMAKTRQRNAVLIYLAPAARTFALLGDDGINARVGQDFWDQLAATLSRGFAAGHYNETLVATIEQVGQALAAHFPALPGDRNELPDKVERD